MTRERLEDIAVCTAVWVVLIGGAFLACAFDGVGGDAGLLLGMLYGGSASIGAGWLTIGRL